MDELSQEQLEAELEQARLAEEARIADLKSRFEALSDVGLLQSAMSISNPALHFRDVILAADAEQAEIEMLAIESAYQLMQGNIIAESWLQSRQSAYAQIDSMLLEGLAEDAAGRPEKLQEYLQLREQIKLQYPKPEGE